MRFVLLLRCIVQRMWTPSALALIQEEELAQSRIRSGPKEFARGAWRVGADKPRGGEMDKGKQDV